MEYRQVNLVSQDPVTRHLVVSDLDGTLLGSDHQLSQQSIECLRRVVDSGITFAVATGRHIRDAEPLLAPLDRSVAMITSNGAMVHDASGQLLDKQVLPEPTLECLLDVSQGFRVHRNIYTADGWLVEEPNEKLRRLHEISGYGYEIVEFCPRRLTDVLKLFFVGEPDRLQTLHRRIKSEVKQPVHVTFSLPNTLEVMPAMVNKATGLAKLIKLTEDSSAAFGKLNTMAFGDGMNDLEMLEMVTMPIVMENGQDELKSKLAAFQKTSACDQHGVATYLAKYFKLGKHHFGSGDEVVNTAPVFAENE